MTFQPSQREPCRCPQCFQAGVSEKPQLRSRRNGEWLHGYDLKRVIEAQEEFWRLVDTQFSERSKRR